MKSRERMLAIGGGGVVGLLLIIFVADSLLSALEARHKDIDSLSQDKRKKEQTVMAGERAYGKLKQWQEVSLPGDPTLASSLYSQWLLKQAVDAGVVGPKVSLGPSRPRADVYIQQSFLVDGAADLRQVTKFLDQFYRVGYLHRISQLKLTPVTGKRSLKLSLTIEALSLKGAPNPKELSPPPAERFAKRTLDEFQAPIFARNMFGAPNVAPKLASPGTQQGSANRSVSFTLKGSDADAGDSLSYAFDGTPLPGAKLDPKTGEFRWTPEKNGDYEVAIRVTDDGFPAKSTVEKIKLAIADPPPAPVAQAPPPRKLEFDPAMHSFVSAILQANGRWQVWVSVRTEGKVLRLAEGDSLAVGSVQGTLAAIRPDEAEFAVQNGSRLVVRIGKPLATEPGYAPGG